MLILKTLSISPMHGYAIAKAIQSVTQDVLSVEEGSLYPALHRMEKRGWIQGEWVRNDTGHRARQYRLTTDGASQLHHQRGRWDRFQEAATRVLEMRTIPTS